MNPPEYAPQYRRAEALRKLALPAILLLALGLVLNYGIAPWFLDFAAHSDCRSLLGIPGHIVVLHLIFTVLPLSLSIPVVTIILPLAWRTLRSRQYPPPGQKTLYRTRIHRGAGAITIATIILALLLTEITLVAYSHLEAYRRIAAIDARYPGGIPCTSETATP
jgi:hypothetical protein